MARLDILTVPDPRLSIKAESVEDIAAVQGLIDDMLETLYATDNGIGLAATQVGRKEAIVIIDLSEKRDQPLVLINPQVTSGTEPALGQEGVCPCRIIMPMLSVTARWWCRHWIAMACLSR